MLADGRATIKVSGQTYDVEPEIIDEAAALPVLSPKRRRVWKRVGIEHYVKLKLAPTRGQSTPADTKKD